MNILHTLNEHDDNIFEAFLNETNKLFAKDELIKLKNTWMEVTFLSDTQFKFAYPYIWHFINDDIEWIEDNIDSYITFHGDHSLFRESHDKPNIPKNKELVFMKVGNIVVNSTIPNGSIVTQGHYEYEYGNLIVYDYLGNPKHMELGEEIVYIDTLENYLLIKRSQNLQVTENLINKALEKGYIFYDKELIGSTNYPLVIDYYQWYKKFKESGVQKSKESYKHKYNNYTLVSKTLKNIEEQLDKFYELDIKIGETKLNLEPDKNGYSTLSFKELNIENYTSVRDFLKEINNQEEIRGGF